MAACYSSYTDIKPQLHHQHHHHQQQQVINNSSNNNNNSVSPSVTSSITPNKDYMRPLHVDCSVEYELPNQAKPPAGVRNEPLLMIHPCYFRKIESQRRSPFVNNLPHTNTGVANNTNTSTSLPPPQTTMSTAATARLQGGGPMLSAAAAVPKRRPIRGQQLPQQVPQAAAQYPVQFTPERTIWDPMPPAIPQSYCKQQQMRTSNANNNNNHSAIVPASYNTPEWTSDHLAATAVASMTNRSPDRPEEKVIVTGKYRQYLRQSRLQHHPYVSLASTFPHQMQQVCYNV